MIGGGVVGLSLAAPPLLCFGLTFSSDVFYPIGVDAGFCPHNNEGERVGIVARKRGAVCGALEWRGRLQRRVAKVSLAIAPDFRFASCSLGIKYYWHDFSRGAC